MSHDSGKELRANEGVPLVTALQDPANLAAIGSRGLSMAHERHLLDIKESFLREVDIKYRAGVKEHGGALWRKPGLIEKAMEECVDQYTFLSTLKLQRDHPELIDPHARDIDEPRIDLNRRSGDIDSL